MVLGFYHMGKSILKVKKQLLFCPGPVNIAQDVKDAAVSHEIGHREEEFSVLLASINKKLLGIYGLKKPHLYHPVVITGSGTAANEAVLSSVVGKKHVLVISNGEFGERLYDISKIHNRKTATIKFNWAQNFEIKKIESYLLKNKVDIIAMVHHETSTGMLNPVAKIGKLCKKYGILLFIDTVSSAGIEKIDLEKWNVAFCSGSAGKAIGSLPGLSYVISKVSELEKLAEITPRTMYLNLYKFYIYSKSLLQTPNTPAINLFFAFDQALSNILKKRDEGKIDSVTTNAYLLRAGMKALNLKFLMEEKCMSSVLTTVLLPNNVSIDELKKRLKDKNIIIYNGKGPLKDKVFQVGNIGELDKKSIIFFMKSLKYALDSFQEDKIHNGTTKLGNTFNPKNKIISSSQGAHFKA